MKLYAQQELIDLARSSSFGENSSVEETTLLNIPIFVCIHLWKPARLIPRRTDGRAYLY